MVFCGFVLFTSLFAWPAAVEVFALDDETFLLQMSADVANRRLELNQTLDGSKSEGVLGQDIQAKLNTTLEKLSLSMHSPSKNPLDLIGMLPDLVNLLRNSSFVAAVHEAIEGLSGIVSGCAQSIERGLGSLRGNLSNSTGREEALSQLQAFLFTQDEAIAWALSGVGMILKPILQQLPPMGQEPLLQYLGPLDRQTLFDRLLARSRSTLSLLFRDSTDFCGRLQPVLAQMARADEFVTTKVPNFVSFMRAQLSMLLPLLSFIYSDVASTIRTIFDAFFTFCSDKIGPLADGVHNALTTLINVASDRLNCTAANVTLAGAGSVNTADSGNVASSIMDSGSDLLGDVVQNIFQDLSTEQGKADPRRGVAMAALIMLGWGLAA